MYIHKIDLSRVSSIFFVFFDMQDHLQLGRPLCFSAASYGLHQPDPDHSRCCPFGPESRTPKFLRPLHLFALRKLAFAHKCITFCFVSFQSGSASNITIAHSRNDPFCCCDYSYSSFEYSKLCATLCRSSSVLSTRSASSSLCLLEVSSHSRSPSSISCTLVQATVIISPRVSHVTCCELFLSLTL